MFVFVYLFLISSCSFPIFVLSPHIPTLIWNRNGNAEICSERLCFALLIQVFQAQQEPTESKASQRSLLDKAKTWFFLRGMLSASMLLVLATWKIWSFLNIKLSIKCPILSCSLSIWAQARVKSQLSQSDQYFLFTKCGITVLREGEMKRLNYPPKKEKKKRKSAMNTSRSWKEEWKTWIRAISVFEGQGPSLLLMRAHTLIFLLLHIGYGESQPSAGGYTAAIPPIKGKSIYVMKSVFCQETVVHTS